MCDKETAAVYVEVVGCSAWGGSEKHGREFVDLIDLLEVLLGSLNISLHGGLVGGPVSRAN